jgi:hypothetical protein
LKLKKATSSSKLKEEQKKNCPGSREKGDKGKLPSKFEQVYMKNTV